MNLSIIFVVEKNGQILSNQINDWTFVKLSLLSYILNRLTPFFFIRAREAAGGCCMSGCCKQTKNGQRMTNSVEADCTSQTKNIEGCCAEKRK